MSSPKNPLYVVNRREKIIEQADGLIDMLFKQFDLEPVFEMLANFWKFLVDNSKDFPMIQVIAQMIDDMVVAFQNFAVLLGYKN